MRLNDFLRVLLPFCLSVLLVGGCRSTPSIDLSDTAPPAPREFRAVWVATVENIDWPSKPGLPVQQQQDEALAIINRCEQIGINAIILQVRPACDALYDSKLEPWSHYLTGTQGQRPEPYYDPLQFWIENCHARGIELHAWFNPYRARHKGAVNQPMHDTHVSRTRPEIVREFNGWMWLDPAEADAQQRTYDVFMDVVKRYDIDGIHIDDYFYPYPDYLTKDKVTADFPDESAWAAYQTSGGKLSRDDWRRDSVNRLIERIYTGLKRTERTTKFGISPFGLGRPDLRPAGITGFSQFDKLYADADLWLHEGWLDYWTPQLYWAINKKGQEFPVLVDYWIAQNRKARHLWPGLYTSRFAPPREDARAGDESAPATQPAAANPREIVDQIEVTRARDGKAGGHVHFSMVALMRNSSLADLMREAYATPALVPASPWLDDKAPPRPSVTLRPRDDTTASVALRPGLVDRPWQWAIWLKYGEAWTFEVRPGATRAVDVPRSAATGPLTAVVVSSVDRSGNESPRVTVVMD